MISLLLSSLLGAALLAPRQDAATPVLALAPDSLELVETAPLETTLDHADLPETWQVWKAMLAGAKETVDVLQFYASSRPGSRLEEVLAELFAAADRGVRVRILLDERFRGEYGETMDRLAAHAGIVLRSVSFADTAIPVRGQKPVARGGVQHAKALVVDGEDVYLGSANLDWRSLEHIQELGLRARSRALAGTVLTCFEADWELAQHGELDVRVTATAHLSSHGEAMNLSFAGAPVRVLPLASPGGPSDPVGAAAALDDLSAIERLLVEAENTIRIQLLTYDAVDRDGFWPNLEDRLRAADARGVKVELLLADWCQRPGRIERLKSLTVLPNVEVRLVTIPEWSGGFVPFSRVIHAKYAVVDGKRAWLGTANWQRDYFTAGRNLGVVVDGAPFAERLERFFQDTWQSPYAAVVDPNRTYEAPRVSE